MPLLNLLSGSVCFCVRSSCDTCFKLSLWVCFYCVFTVPIFFFFLSSVLGVGKVLCLKYSACVLLVSPASPVPNHNHPRCSSMCLVNVSLSSASLCFLPVHELYFPALLMFWFTCVFQNVSSCEYFC